MSSTPNLSNRCLTNPNYISDKIKGLDELVESCTQELLKDVDHTHGVEGKVKDSFYTSYRDTIIRECICYLNNMKSVNKVQK